MKPLRLIGIVFATGFALLIVGVAYDVLFAGIPYQDPTPELAASYDRHARIATVLCRAGGGTLGTAVVATIVIFIKNRRIQPTK